MTNGKQYLSYVAKVILLSLHGKVWFGVGCRGSSCEKLLETSLMFEGPMPSHSKMDLPLGKLIASETSAVKQLSTMDGLMLGQVDPQRRLLSCGAGLTGPVDPWKTDSTLEHTFLAEHASHSWETVPCELPPHWSSSWRTADRGKDSSWRSSWWTVSHGKDPGVGRVLSLQMKVQHRQHVINSPHSLSPYATSGDEVENSGGKSSPGRTEWGGKVLLMFLIFLL